MKINSIRSKLKISIKGINSDKKSFRNNKNMQKIGNNFWKKDQNRRSLKLKKLNENEDN